MINTFIDAIQDSKKQFVTTFVTDKKFQTELIKLVEAQALTAKASVKSSLAIVDAFTKNANGVFSK